MTATVADTNTMVDDLGIMELSFVETVALPDAVGFCELPCWVSDAHMSASYITNIPDSDAYDYCLMHNNDAIVLNAVHMLFHGTQIEMSDPFMYDPEGENLPEKLVRFVKTPMIVHNDPDEPIDYRERVTNWRNLAKPSGSGSEIMFSAIVQVISGWRLKRFEGNMNIAPDTKVSLRIL